MISTEKINIHWLRRDLRLNDNNALFQALSENTPVVLLYIFETNNPINANDKANFIYNSLKKLQKEVEAYGSSILIKQGDVFKIWESLVNEFNINKVYFNEEYEPYTINRDTQIKRFLESKGMVVKTYKDHVLFHKDEIVKGDRTPYTVFTPYFKKWMIEVEKFTSIHYPSEKLIKNLANYEANDFPSLKNLGYVEQTLDLPEINLDAKLPSYELNRDFPFLDASTRISVDLRYGTISIRDAFKKAHNLNALKWIAGLAWRDFYHMILFYFPHTENKAFKKKFDFVEWRNNESEFKAWCEGKTGYPIVDAGMRSLNETGFMHNRVRMIVASFLTKHLLIDWRWGEAYFAVKLLDYDMANNVGGWQWACGSGNDAVPYFRVFNPTTQQEKFDPEFKYCKLWIEELNTKRYAQPIVEHTFARNRAIKTYSLAGG
ncbi:cryptochrome/photolyase family protein [Pedobacter flavus]|uniref:Deoxyribodipyrimidine photo-lyase n=1 Tax=Pedobacter flavus TaxID=3113906 RepID=A0ABU7GYQ8_9SPHI|nr:deoxyribodipyrimidine photo-lyase [Pedobacter sp. VNH31]MEE1884136.1 deoxyribodipyrimidine photo-lyase [Pedobacter sp. VNH31]